MKLAVIGGAGLLGSTAAFCAGGMDVLEEIRLLDIRENMTMSHVMDMDQALSSCSRTKVTKGDYKRLEDCELILITASVPETGTGTRDSYLQANRDIVTEICSKLRGLNQNHVIINAGFSIENFVSMPFPLYPFVRRLAINADSVLISSTVISSTTAVAYA